MGRRRPSRRSCSRPDETGGSRCWPTRHDGRRPRSGWPTTPISIRDIQRIPGDEQDTSKILAQLLALGAQPTCHLISENTDLDGRDPTLTDALDEIVGSMHGTLVVCVPGKLAYYEGEEQGERYILHREA